MVELGSAFQTVLSLIPAEAQGAFFSAFLTEFEISQEAVSAPAGAILMGMYVLEYAGFARHIDALLGEEHTSIENLKAHYQQRREGAEAMVPSTGILMSLMVADMIACPRNITRTYKIQEMAADWQTGPLLGIEPSLLTDDRILGAMSKLGKQSSVMEEILYKLVMEAGEKADIPLNKFILDTTLLQLSGGFEKAPKVVPGRGKDSFSQLIVSLVIASGSRLPVGFSVLSGNTSDSTTLPDIYHTVDKIADDGSIEFLMDRIYPTPSNIRFLQEQQNKRMVYWVSPLKMGLSQKEVRKRVEDAYDNELWKKISYRSTRETSGKVAPPLMSFESTWTLTDTIKPELQPGQTRRPKGSIQTVAMEVRCVFYRHEINAQSEKEHREIKKEQLEGALQAFLLKLNQRKYRELDYCKTKLEKLLKEYSDVKSFVLCSLSKTDKGIITLSWVWDDSALTAEKLYDGIFALISNYTKQEVNANQLVTKYRSRDQVEVNFKDMKGILDLGKIIYQKPERIDTFIFLKVIAYFILAFLRSYAEKEGVKTTEKKLQEGMGDLLLTAVEIQPLGVKSYAVARDCEMNKLLRRIFQLPNPVDLIKVLNDAESARMKDAVKSWYKNWLLKNRSS